MQYAYSSLGYYWMLIWPISKSVLRRTIYLQAFATAAIQLHLCYITGRWRVSQRSSEHQKDGSKTRYQRFPVPTCVSTANKWNWYHRKALFLCRKSIAEHGGTWLRHGQIAQIETHSKYWLSQNCRSGTRQTLPGAMQESWCVAHISNGRKVSPPWITSEYVTWAIPFYFHKRLSRLHLPLLCVWLVIACAWPVWKAASRDRTKRV